MQTFLFKHHKKFFIILTVFLVSSGFYFLHQPITTDKHILIGLEKRIEPTNPDKPYILVLEWRFPKGSNLYDPKETKRYNLEHSKWSDTGWTLKDDSFGIAANQEVGMLAIRYSSVDELNQAYSKLHDPSLWNKAIKETH